MKIIKERTIEDINLFEVCKEIYDMNKFISNKDVYVIMSNETYNKLKENNLLKCFYKNSLDLKCRICIDLTGKTDYGEVTLI